MKIELTRGLFATIDSEDFPLVSQFRWRANKSKRKFYAITGQGKDAILLHRLIMSCPANMQVDHINSDSLDCRRDNMRIVTNQQNCMNRIGKGKYKGVHLYKQTGKFSSQIRINGKKIHLGYFREPEEAAIVYNRMAVYLFGQYAKLNIIEGTNEQI